MATGTVKSENERSAGIEVAADDSSSAQMIQSRLDRTGRYVKLVDICSQLMIWAAGFLGAMLVLILVDHWVVGLSFWGRLLALLTLVVTSLLLVIRKLVPPLIKRVNPTYSAHLLEQSEPSLKNSLVSFLFLRSDRRQAPDVVYRAMQQRAAADIARVEMDAAVDRTKMIHVGYVLVAVLVVGGLYTIFSPKDPFQTVARVLAPWKNIPRPARVQLLQLEPGETRAYQGRFVDVSVVLRTRAGSSDVPVWLVYGARDGRIVDQRIRMQRSGRDIRHRGKLPRDEAGIQQDLVYRIEAGDATTRKYHVQLLPAPSMVVRQIEYQYPAYTGRQSEVVSRRGDIAGLEGTLVRLIGRANQEIRSAYLQFDPQTQSPAPLTGKPPASRLAGQTIPMTVQGREAEVQFRLELQDDRRTPWHTSYQLRFTNADGESNRQPLLYRLDVTPDLPPVVEIVDPTQLEIEVPADGRRAVEVRAVDPDFALRGVKLRAAMAGNRLLDQPLLDQLRTGQVTARFDLVPRRLGLVEGDVAVYWAVASDNRMSARDGQPRPNISRTTDYKIRVVAPRGKETTGQGSTPTGDATRLGQPKQPDQGQDQRQDQGQGQGKDKSSDQRGGGEGQGQQGESEGQGQQEEGQGQQGESQAQQGEGQQDGGGQNRPASGESASPSAGKEQSGQGSAGQGDRSDNQAAENRPAGSEPAGSESGDSSSGHPSQSTDQRGGTAGREGADRQSADGRQGAQPQGTDSSRNASGQGGEDAAGESSEPLPSDGQRDGDAFDRILRRMRELRERQLPKDNASDKSPSAAGTPDASDDSPKQPAAPSSGADRRRDAAPNGQDDVPANKKPRPDQSPGQSNAAPSSAQADGSRQPGARPADQSTSDSQGTTGQSDRATEATDGRGANRQGAGDKRAAGGPDQQGSEQSPTRTEQGPEENGTGQGQQDSGGNPRGTDRQAPAREQPDRTSPTESAGESQVDSDTSPGQSSPPTAEGQGREPTSGQPDTGKGAGQENGDQRRSPPSRSEAGSRSDGRPGPSDTAASGNPGAAADATPKGNSSEPGGDDPNIEYAKKATDLALEYLKDQQTHPDQKLLDRLGWTEDDIRKFVRRWEQMKREAQRHDQRGQQARQALDDALRSLGLGAGRDRLRSSGSRTDAVRGVRQSGRRSRPPAEYRDLYDAYLRSTARSASSQDDTKP